MAVKFLNDGNFPDNVKARFGTGNDLSIFASGTTSVLDIPAGDFYIGDYQTFSTGSFTFARVSGESGLYQPEEGWFAFRANGNTNHVFIGSDGTDVIEIDHNSMLLYDNMKLKIGTSSDLQIYHDGSDSIIKDDGTGSLDILSSHVHLKSSGGTSNLAQFFSGGHSYIYANNVLRIEATTTGATITGGLEVGGASSRFSDSVRFTSNATFDDNSKAIFGDDSDLQIYHNGSNSVIEDAGTGDLVVKFSNDLLIQGQNGDKSINCNEGNSVQLYYDNSEKLETKSNGIEVTGDVLDRDIPCVLTSHFSDDSSTTSYLFMPFNNNSESSSNQYYNYFAAPQAGKVVSIMLMHVSGSMSSSFTTQLRVAKNGSTADTSGELTPSNGTSDGSYVEYAPGTTFAKGDRLQFSYQKSAGSKYWRGATATIVIELTDYDI
tara:strand:- start:560 stop:1858 length:1299 start_codon:yes stop_codon:yes gene_type:complete